MTGIADAAAAIRDMRIRGAGRIARAGAEAIGSFARGYGGSSLEEFLRDLDGAKAEILASRPTAVSLWNGVCASAAGAYGAATLGEALEAVASGADRFIESSSRAVEAISEIGARSVSDGDTVLTHCNSSAAVGVLIEAHRRGRSFKAYATETRPWRQGLVTARELAAAGVDVTLIADSAARHVMKRVDRVFVGADTVMSDGSVVNKIGTSQIAAAARDFGADFAVCAETYKFSPKTVSGEPVPIEERDGGELAKAGEVPPSVKIYNPVFDVTPPGDVSRLITEEGVMHPSAAYSVLLRRFGAGAAGLGGIT
ncbi:MAG: ribose 1,5-bisphosphate isomerase [Candidatus Methanoplasma sp.]|nr:ribose 1,5-bisphosphate isomerase [Candidatus Methanoplasma sp.]